MNLFENQPEKPMPEELMEVLEERENVRIERIISCGHQSPEGFWYDQTEDEWVLIVQGEAVLELADGEKKRLGAGDYFMLPAHCKLRVAWTSTQPSCIWLCIFSR